MSKFDDDQRVKDCPPELKAVLCNSETVKTVKNKKKIILCRNYVYVHPSMDHRYLVGRCRKCDAHKAVKCA